MASRPREIALLTNPLAGKGRGRRAASLALPRLRAGGVRVRNLAGRDAAEAEALAAAAVGEGVEALVVCGGDGLVHLAAQVLAGTGVPLGVVPAGTGNDVARYLGSPRDDPRRGRGRRARRTHPHDRPGHRRRAPYFVTVLASGFDAKVNERANAMSWPTGQMRYNIATVAELGVFRPLPTPSSSTAGVERPTRCSSRSATARPSAAACGSARAPCSTTACSTSSSSSR